MKEFRFGDKHFYMTGTLGNYGGVFEWRISRLGGEMKQIAGTLDFVTHAKTHAGARAALRKWLMKAGKLPNQEFEADC